MGLNASRRRFLGALPPSCAAAAFACGASPWLASVSPAQGSAARIVIVGGGIAGATCAIFLRRYEPALEVTLVEPRRIYVTKSFSNAVLADFQSLDELNHTYTGLEQAGCRLVHQRAASVDADSKSVRLADGASLDFDKLVLCPGISLRWETVDGLDESTTARVPHAWTAGDQIAVLSQQLRDMDPGGTAVVVVPPPPFSAPLAPYERASLMADFLQANKPASKLLLVDAANEFPLQTVFEELWTYRYGEAFERIDPSELGELQSVDPSTLTMRFSSGEEIRADVLNYIPPQSAGSLAIETGLTDGSGWCPTDARSFESTRVPDIHVIGDAASAGGMLKTASAANLHAKACAFNLIASLRGEEPIEMVYTVTSYVRFALRNALSVVDTYRVAGGSIVRMEVDAQPDDLSPRGRQLEARYALGWYRSVMEEAFAEG